MILKQFWILFLIGILLIDPAIIQAQVYPISEQEILIEISKRGLDEDEVRLALIKKGIDLNNLDDINDDGISVVRETILELEKEKEAQELKLELLQEAEIQDSLSLVEDNLDSIPKVGSDLILDDELEPLIYGQGLFRNNTFQIIKTEDNFLAPENYVIGSGDELAVSIWGRSQLDSKLLVGKDGYIKILGGAQRVYLKGFTLSRAKEKLSKVFSNYYSFRADEFDLDLSYSRIINVNIYGEVNKPGSVTLAAINTAFAALSSINGLNDIGSVRNIKLIHSNGDQQTLDLYKLMKESSVGINAYLQDNDVILVPVAENVIDLQGAVRRPMKYEIIEGEGLKELFSYAGGLQENAYKTAIRVLRYTDDGQTLVDVNWKDLENRSENYLLNKGDVVYVDTIINVRRNYVRVEGEVNNPGEYQRLPNMKLDELVKRAGLRPESRTDIAFLKRANVDGTITYEQINLDEIVNNPSNEKNFVLKDKDVLTVWSSQRFADEANFAINGAVRFPGSFPFDVSRKIQISEAIMLAGGLRRDASEIAIIHRTDPLNPKLKEYITINNLKDIVVDPEHGENMALNAFDSLVIYSENEFLEESFVRIEGAINQPGLFQYGKNMNIKDLITLAGGFKMAAATNNIEISRVIIQNNEPTRVVIRNIDVNRDIKEIKENGEFYKLKPFDNVAVRFVPEFELQQNVILTGEIKFPGPYTIVNENERISSIVNRAGGLTKEAFPAGATLIRPDQNYGSVVIKLNEILDDPSSQFNFTVRDGDTINVPKIKEFVTIKGATRAKDVLNVDAINIGNIIHVPYHKSKDALFYINEYAGGLAENADPKAIFVEHPNGEVKKAGKNLLFKKRVEIRKGSVIRVGYKPVKKDDAQNQKDVDWTQVLGDSVKQAVSILTLILLVQRLD